MPILATKRRVGVVILAGGIGDGVRVIAMISCTSRGISSEERGVVGAEFSCLRALRCSALEVGVVMKLFLLVLSIIVDVVMKLLLEGTDHD